MIYAVFLLVYFGEMFIRALFGTQDIVSAAKHGFLAGLVILGIDFIAYFIRSCFLGPSPRLHAPGTLRAPSGTAGRNKKVRMSSHAHPLYAWPMRKSRRLRRDNIHNSS